MTGDRPSPRGGDLAPWLILGVMAAGLTLLAVVWTGGTLGAAVTGGGWHPPSFSLATLAAFLRGGPAALWPNAPTAGPIAGMLAATAALAAPLVPAARWLGRRRSRGGLAAVAQLADLTRPGMADRARLLRPSLAGADEIDAREVGIRLGDMEPRGPALYASWEDTLLALMGPRSGKTSAVAVPTILRAPGPVVVTSVREDVYTLTATAQARRTDPEDGRPAQLWALDPQHIAFLPRDWWFDILAEARTFEGAWRLGGHFISLLGDSDRLNSDFWLSAARALLTGMFLSASRAGRPISQVLRWLGNPADTEPLDALRGHPVGADLRSRMDAAVETRDGIYQTAREAVSCLLDPDILAWVTPPAPTDTAKVRRFDPDAFVAGRDTLYLLSKKGTASAAGIVAALTDAVLRAAERRADRSAGRLDPPLTVILDEAANVCRIADLPDMYSYMGGKGVILITIIQNYPQGQAAWGRTGMAALWNASTVKLIGAGVDDPRLAEDVSKLIGEHDVPVRSVSYGGQQGRSTSTTPQLRRIVPPDKVRSLRRGHAFLFATGHPVTLLKLRPWFGEPGADRLRADLTRQRDLLKARAERATSTADSHRQT
ncbi:hypothetical protein Acsp04_63790 [Actinomadura sp. NBRC 104425]|uniref:type IV secretory system conjugative DNA transfer family protein n=1 Tax=Actinomadura sp. NBRC 104425 TaxID=3032204 RepID=UPI0024A22FBF|nr:type IV secretory system conjugative DNA transfer family protein [Actinomadura sp. NBRC 104425]GLZ16144.1 hypothetical protein Acsp04_63790 [Actinomadura sp. NBRC 104425]